MAKARDRNYVVGVAAMVIGVFLALIAALWAHFTGLSEFDDVGREIYPNIPRGWVWVLIAQILSLGGVLIAMAGTTLAFLYEKKMTWARASIGAGLFTALMIILFGIIPNEWLATKSISRLPSSKTSSRRRTPSWPSVASPSA